MDVLIAVLSYPVSPWRELMCAQMETWDGFYQEGVETIYFQEGRGLNMDFVNVLEIPDVEGYNLIYLKIKRALQVLWRRDWKFMFLTNSSSYVCKRRLMEFSRTMPETGCYCGELRHDTPGFPFASGCGMLLSRDVVQILKEELPESYPGFHHEGRIFSDVAIAMELAKHGVGVTPGGRRFDYWSHPHETIPDEYHYRCKSDTSDRNKDIEAFKRIAAMKYHYFSKSE